MIDILKRGNIKSNKAAQNGVPEVVTDKDVTPKDYQNQWKADEVKIIDQLGRNNDEFHADLVFVMVKDFISAHDRILYSIISNYIYNEYEKINTESGSSKVDRIISNMNALQDYAYTCEVKDKQQEEIILKTKKAIVKMWDHINLASQQYEFLKESDEGYQKRFDSQIGPEKQKMWKEINSRLLTIVGIFTALAFLIFGSLTSLNAELANQNAPLLKLICICLVWALGMLNVLYVFLFCCGKMVNSSFKELRTKHGRLWEKYPIVFLTNELLLGALALTGWIYFISLQKLDGAFGIFLYSRPTLVSVLGIVVILIIMVFSIYYTCKKS